LSTEPGVRCSSTTSAYVPFGLGFDSRGATFGVSVMARSIGVSTTGHDQLALKAHPGPALGGGHVRVFNGQVQMAAAG
jgi:hypothetical protein